MKNHMNISDVKRGLQISSIATNHSNENINALKINLLKI